MKICLVYLDDIIIFSKTVKEPLERLQAVFTRSTLNLRRRNIFLQKEDDVLGVWLMVGSNGVETDPDKISKVTDWPTPANADERFFLN